MQSNQPMLDFVTGLLKDKLSPFYFYHNVDHTLYVLQQALVIGRAEGCTETDFDLLKAAALWHDAGYITSAFHHEKESCLLALQYLPQFGYADAAIQAICNMIMATRIPQAPASKLEYILADADLSYLGSGQVAEKAADLFRERQYLDPSLTQAVWNDQQIAFLVGHHYFTSFCKEKLQPFKHAYLQQLLNGIE